MEGYPFSGGKKDSMRYHFPAILMWYRVQGARRRGQREVSIIEPIDLNQIYIRPENLLILPPQLLL
jgi:hypothetical protein